MCINYVICVLIIVITSVVCWLYRSYLNKKDDKPEIVETPSYDEFSTEQYRSSVRCMCDCVQDDGKFVEYPSEYMVWQTGYESANIKDIAIFITSTRNIYKPNEYELVLQTGIPLENLESLYTHIIYRVIVLKKYKKEDKPMDEKQKILNDIEEAQRKLDEARKKLDEYNTGYKRWKPKEGEEFWYIDSSGSVNYTRFMSGIQNDNMRFKNYNCFKTREQAEVETEKILVRRQLEDIAKRLNKNEEIDWRNLEQNKYYLSCDNYNRCGKICCVCSNNTVQGAVYCLDKNFLDVAKREIGEDRLIKYIRGEG